MRTKVTLVLLLLNVALFYYIVQFERQAVLPAAGKLVLGPEVAAIDALSRTDRTGATLSVEKRGESWWLTKPYEWPANFNAVSRILSELRLLENETSFAVADLAKSGQSLADYGLTEPALVFSFTAAGKTYVLKIGDDTKIGNRLYLLSPDGKRIHVVGRSLADSLGLPLEKVRAEAIFSVPVFEVRSLGIQTAAPANLKVRLRREGALWSFETPILARANKNGVEVTINALNSLQARKFLDTRDADLERTGLAAPALRLTLEGNNRRETLLLGNPVAAAAAGAKPAGDVEYYAKIEDKPAVFTTQVPAALVDTLRASQETLRDPRILEFDPRTVTAATLGSPGQPDLSLQRLEAAQGAGAWQLVSRAAAGQAPQTTAADPTLVADLLQQLSLLSARKFLSDAPSAADLENYGFNRPEREVTLNLSTGGGPQRNEPTTLTLQIGRRPDDQTVAYARLTNAPFVYQIDPEILEQTVPLVRQYRQRLLRELPAGARISGLTLTEIGTTAPLYSRQLADNESWEAAEAGEPEARRRALVILLNQCHALRAQRFTADTFNPDHAEAPGGNHPWKYRLDLTVSFTGGNGATPPTASVLWLTDRLGGTTQLAGTPEFGGVTFAVTQDMLDALFALTFAEKHDPGPPANAPAPTPKPAEAPKP